MFVKIIMIMKRAMIIMMLGNTRTRKRRNMKTKKKKKKHNKQKENQVAREGRKGCVLPALKIKAKKRSVWPALRGCTARHAGWVTRGPGRRKKQSDLVPAEPNTTGTLQVKAST